MSSHARLSRSEAIDMLIDAKIVEPTDRSMVLGSYTEIVFGFGAIDADKDGFFSRSDVCRLIGYGQAWKRDQTGRPVHTEGMT
jgi:hypothetical protein